MGAAIFDGKGGHFGRIRELTVDPGTDVHRIHGFVVKQGSSKSPLLLVKMSDLDLDASEQMYLKAGAEPEKFALGSSGAHASYLLLERDLLDQQIIDVHGHKVVRVNDVDLVWTLPDQNQAELSLRISEVEVGMRGALRRLFKGLPPSTIELLSRQFSPSVIPWEFVDLIERDPARRVKLRVEQDRLARMHPSDIADILEELAPAERRALFESLDEEVAAEALEEVDPRMQQALIESLDSEQIAGIVEEMDPGAAADLLSELSEEQTDAILEEMAPEERHDVEELLEFPADSAAGRMTTEYIAMKEDAAVVDAIVMLRAFEGDLENLVDIFLIDEQERLTHVVPLVRLLLAKGADPLKDLADGHTVSCDLDTSGKKVAELFDKYNLRSLPVLDEEKRLAGVIHAEQVISLLRSKR